MAKLNVMVPAVDVTIDGTVYTKVERKAAVGDVLRMIGGPDYITDGGFYEVTRIDRAGDPQITDDDGDAYDAYEDTFEVYAKVAEKPRRLTVGDYAKVVDNSGAHRSCNVGDIVKITERSGIDNDLLTFETGTGGIGYMYELRFVRATDAEVAAAKRQLKCGDFTAGDSAKLTKLSGATSGFRVGDTVAIKGVESGGYALRITKDNGTVGFCDAEHLVKVTTEDIAKAAEEKRWSAIGRKVSEIKAGDIVEITRYQSGDKVGAVVEVDGLWADSSLQYKSTKALSGRYLASINAVKLVTPVEQRFDR